MSDFLNKNGGIVTLAKASIVPIGFYAFSKYKNYDSKKTIKVTIIGSLVVLGAIVYNELSGFGSPSNKFSNRLFGYDKTKALELNNQVPKISNINEPAKPLPVQGSAKKISDCQKQWDSKAETDKGAIGETRNSRHNSFMYNCVNDVKPTIIYN